jgi:hypothetical protein
MDPGSRHEFVEAEAEVSKIPPVSLLIVITQGALLACAIVRAFSRYPESSMLAARNFLSSLNEDMEL